MSLDLQTLAQIVMFGVAMAVMALAFFSDSL